MASVPNRVYPQNEFPEIRTNEFSAKVASTCSPHTFTGFLVQGAITQYQPVVFSTNTSSSLYVSGATAWGQGGIIGVSADTYANGATVDVISRGIVPFISSGAAIINSGSPVIFAASGSTAIANFVNAPGLSSGSSLIGYVVTAGAAVAASACSVWVCPQIVGTS